MGRLFDAASALLGICNEPRYEGEGAILLEAEIAKGFGTDAAAELKTLLAEAEKTTSSLAQEAADPTAELDAVERYQFGLIKNTATEQSTALFRPLRMRWHCSMICRQESIRLSSRAASTKRWCVPSSRQQRPCARSTTSISSRFRVEFS